MHRMGTCVTNTSKTFGLLWLGLEVDSFAQLTKLVDSFPTALA